MPFQYKKVLVIGATSGIGKALASRFVQEGSIVIVVGRRKENLEAFVHEHGKDKASAVPFDITELDKIPNFVTNITKTHTDLDCVLLNSGIQRMFDFSKPETVDIDVVQTEFTTNYLSNLALTNAFLPFLKSKKGESALIYTTSSLALVPIIRCANYCASKAALHHYILCLREQLRGSTVKIVELYPPAVQTELHDEKHQPQIKNGRQYGMPLDQFTDEAYEGLAAGKEEVTVGSAQDWYNKFESARQELFHGIVKMRKQMDDK
ncbi:hypothetical protein HO133_005703 [Letharia lupina]|uniref:Uncharacterized protein n=1 Tax=Letharia lupina TaxID=560253 RepID=A0A8H6C7Y5_9LECA|nr:uncharacterized protein HO133_005703 [Letharia lupina]KAF6218356.1 hypothetical protein HO133_005703 [Letharia lupina]